MGGVIKMQKTLIPDECQCQNNDFFLFSVGLSTRRYINNVLNLTFSLQ